MESAFIEVRSSPHVLTFPHSAVQFGEERREFHTFQLPSRKSATAWKYPQTCQEYLSCRRWGSHGSAGRMNSTFFLLVSCWAHSLTLKMKATCSSEMSMRISGLHGVIFQEDGTFQCSSHWTASQDCAFRNRISSWYRCVLSEPNDNSTVEQQSFQT
jgi:hypothetical protein